MDNVIIYDAIDGVLNECETVMGGVNNIQGALANGVVKSVQRGTMMIPSWGPGNSSVPISSVYVAKSVVIAETTSEGGSSISPAISYSLSSNAINITAPEGNASIPVYFSWQVIEFY